ncbi:MAG TPA: patatin-like phospholipase family protein [Spirochaetota bacterium]|nr:patatin-like phospholipase family protein [Spirochaetota bacterium]HPC43136.1 patatin-like phospholipase family protein [Spirochaetota bacterium]HPL17366.1 patatin-like phospholipase family protein [Spirochaetota bacterium]HQF10511.1 patatin-like phospholipase family protein [Spirochaetota bacterium]HQH99518.1 patatin-like phospholipase family protein [Spirochaetota bacterium]
MSGNPLKYFRNHKVGLALGSGGAKGLAHVAVIEFLESMDIPIDYIAGSSIGAVIGALHGMGSMGRFKEDIMKFTFREMIGYMDPMVPRSGIIQGKGFVKFMERYIPRDAKIEDLKTPLAVLATDYATGSSVIFRKGNVLEALRASVSIPGVLVPVRYGKTILIDGGVANPLPINIVRSMGAGITIAVNLHPRLKKRGLKHFAAVPDDGSGQADDARVLLPAGDGSSSSGGGRWFAAIEQWLKSGRDAGSDKDRMPNILEIMAGSVDIMEYVNTALLLRYNAPTVLIEPDVTDVQTLDFVDAKKIINEGYLACVRAEKVLNRRVRAWV